MDLKVALLFLFVCIPLRCLLVYIAKTRPNYLVFMGIIALIQAIGFMYFHVSGTRPTGIETGGKRIWWDQLRIAHSINYFIFAYLAFFNKKIAYIPLLIDVIIGITAWLIHYYKENKYIFIRYKFKIP